MKVVINRCFGGFALSREAVMLYAKLKGITLYPFIDRITKEVYGDKATLDNPHILIHYATQECSTEEELNDHYFSDHDIPRDDESLVQVVKELGKRANSPFSKLKVIKIPDGVEWQIEEYDGMEHIAEKHRTWGW